jgi:hypothetical protein
MGCALLSLPSRFENSDPQKSEQPWEHLHMVAVFKYGNLWRQKKYMCQLGCLLLSINSLINHIDVHEDISIHSSMRLVLLHCIS